MKTNFESLRDLYNCEADENDLPIGETNFSYENCKKYSHYSNEIELFDFDPSQKRIIFASEIFSKDTNIIVNSLNKSFLIKQVIIINDMLLKSKNPIVNVFYWSTIKAFINKVELLKKTCYLDYESFSVLY